MAHVAAHDDIRAAGGGQLQVFVIFRIAALPDGLGWFNPLCCEDHYIEDALAPFNRDETIKLRSEDHLVKFVLGRL